MANEWTNADSLRALNTGAVSDDTPQTDPGASLGGYKSSSFVKTLKYVPGNIPGNIEIVYVSAANGTGTGTITFSGSTVTWRAPGSSTAGASVTIANGETKIIEDGEDPNKFVRIAKISTEEATQNGTLLLRADENNAVAMGNVTGADALAGDTKYRSIALSNGSAGAITNVKIFAGALVPAVPTDQEYLPASGAGEIWSGEFVGVFPDSGYFTIYSSAGAVKEVVYATRSTFGYAVTATGRGCCGTSATAGSATDTFAPCYGVELATETPVGDQITASPNEDTPPAAISFSGAFTEATAITVASIASGDWTGLHLKRDTAAGSGANVNLLAGLTVMFTAGGTEYIQPLSALYRIAGEVEWRVWVSETASIDFSEAPDATGTTLPVSVPVTPPVSGTKDYWYAVRYMNRYGLASLNQYLRRITLNATGESVTGVPSSPYGTALADTFDGYVTVSTNYDKGNDDGFAANRLAIYASVGVDPDPDVDTAVATRGIPDHNRIGDTIELIKDIGPYAAEADLRVVVRVYRSTDMVNDGNTDVVTLTTASGATAPRDVTANR